MPRLRATIDIVKFDSKEYTKALKKQVELQTKQAARALVRAAVSQIPVDTGMAAGSFLNLSRYLRNIGLTITAKSRTGKYYGKPGGPGHPIPKNKNTPGDYGLVIPNEKVFTWVGNRHVFTFQSKVVHLTLNDLIGTKGTGPWNAFQAGQAAFLQEMRNLKKRLPSVKSYLTKTTVSLGAGHGLKRTSPVRIQRQERN